MQPRLLDQVRSAIRVRHLSRRTEDAYLQYRAEVSRILDELEGRAKLVVSLLYGSGPRLLECLRLRVKDVDFHENRLIVRNGKGGRDRATILPATLSNYR